MEHKKQGLHTKNNPKEGHHTEFRKILLLESLRAQYQDPSYLTSTDVTYFMNMKIIILLNMQMTLPPTLLLTTIVQSCSKDNTCFANNKVKTNHDACHLPLSSQKSSNIQIANFPIKSSTAKKLLGINLDNDLKFDIHVESICPKANRKVIVLARIANYMELPKRTIFMNLFFKSSVSLLSCYLDVSQPCLKRQNQLH